MTKTKIKQTNYKTYYKSEGYSLSDFINLVQSNDDYVTPDVGQYWFDMNRWGSLLRRTRDFDMEYSLRLYLERISIFSEGRDIFYAFKEEKGYPPTCKVFVDYCMTETTLLMQFIEAVRSYDKVVQHNNEWIPKDINVASEELIEKVFNEALPNRLQRMYNAYMNEEGLILKTLELYPNSRVFSSDILDSVFGVDFALVREDGKVAFVHSTTKSKNAQDKLKRKATYNIEREFVNDSGEKVHFLSLSLANGRTYFWEAFEEKGQTYQANLNGLPIQVLPKRDFEGHYMATMNRFNPKYLEANVTEALEGLVNEEYWFEAKGSLVEDLINTHVRTNMLSQLEIYTNLEK